MTTKTKIKTERPRFTGLKLFNHAEGYLSFWYPPEWRLQELDTPHLTVSLQPEATIAATNVTIEVKDLQAPLTAEEYALLEEGVKEGLAQLENLDIERWQVLDAKTIGEWGLEWICYFTDEGQRRKRRARLFVSDQYFYSVIYQGETEADYAYWQGMFEFVMLTVGTNPFSVSDWHDTQDWGEFAEWRLQ